VTTTPVTTPVPKYLHFRLTLHAPAIVTTLSGDPNSAATQPFIPGSCIRGAIAGRLIAGGVDPAGPRFREMILSGAIRYLHAYPRIGGERAWPTPVSWRRNKDTDLDTLDLAAYSGEPVDTDDNDRQDDTWPSVPLTSVSQHFVAPSAQAGRRLVETPRIGSRLHQQRDRVKGRPGRDAQDRSQGAIFAYEFLEGEQEFRGMIQFMPEAVARIAEVKELLGAPILIGRSRRAGYGGEAALDDFDETGNEYRPTSSTLTTCLSSNDRFRLFLTSGYLGRHPATGQHDPAALDHELEALLPGAIIERRRWGFDVIGAFNQKWRLETPQVTAVCGGSVLVLKATRPICLSTLRGIEHAGIGERRVEGFGRVLFLNHSESEGAFRIQVSDAEPPVPIAQSTGSDDQIGFLERRIILAAAEAEIDRIANLDLAPRATVRPSNSLIGRLRVLFRTVIDEPTAQAALGQLAIWCSDCDETPHRLRRPARGKLNECRLAQSGPTLLNWLRSTAMTNGDQTGWSTLIVAAGAPSTLTGLAGRHHLTGTAAAQRALNAQSAWLRIRLIDALLAALARRNRIAEGA